MATWYIVDGDLPFLQEFPELPENPIDDAPLSVWRIVNGELPFKLSFPEMPSINDAPSSMWRIIDGELPFKLTFPPMPKPPKMEKPYKADRQVVILKSYNQTVKLPPNYYQLVTVDDIERFTIKLREYHQTIIVSKSTQARS